MGFFKVDADVVAAAQAIEEEEAKSFSLKSGVYPVKIVAAYVQESSTSEATAITVLYIAEGWKFPQRFSMWFQGQDGSTTRTAKRRDGTEYPDETFGMKQVRALGAVCGVDIENMEPVDGQIDSKDGAKDVKVFAEFTDKIIYVGIQDVLEDKYGEETESRNVADVIWIGRSETDTEGFVFPWGRKQDVSKFQAVIDKEPTKDKRELSKPGAVDTEAAKEEAAAAFGGFGA